MKKKPKDKNYRVSLYIKHSYEYKVKAPNVWQARLKAFIKLIGNLTQKDFTIYVDLDE